MPAGPDHSLGGHPHRSATDRPHPSRRHAPRRRPATTPADRHPRRRQQANDQTLRTGRRRNPASVPVPHETDGLVPFWAPRHLPLVPRTQALAASPAGGLEVAADPPFSHASQAPADRTPARRQGPVCPADPRPQEPKSPLGPAATPSWAPLADADRRNRLGAGVVVGAPRAQRLPSRPPRPSHRQPFPPVPSTPLGRLAQRKSAAFTRQRPQVRNLQRPQEDTGWRAPSAEPEHPIPRVQDDPRVVRRGRIRRLARRYSS
jgi:hypothetical protein